MVSDLEDRQVEGVAASRPAAADQPVLRGARFFFAHTPGLVRHGSRPARDIAAGARGAAMDGSAGGTGKALSGPPVADAIAASLRDYGAALAYPPNQVCIGNLPPEALDELPRPWFRAEGPGERRGPHGEIMPEEEFLGLLKMFDAAGLVRLEAEFAAEVRPTLAAHPLLATSELERLSQGVAAGEPASEEAGGLPEISLQPRDGRRVGTIRADHAEDDTLTAQVLLENLACKATAVMALRELLAGEGLEPGEVGYLLNSGEEAVGDRYQRGGGNLAKAVGELCGCTAATGVDIKGFCAGPVHALIIAAGLVRAGIHRHVAVVGGCSLAKLGMKYQGHLRHGQPILEDMLAGVAMLVSENDGRSPAIRLESLGMHPISAGASQQAILEQLVAKPIERLGLGFRDVDKYATELQNPEATEPSGSGNVPLLNYRTIAALAARRGEIGRAEIDAFVKTHGMPGFAPTQGHIASALPYMAHALDGLRTGKLRRVMFLAKGSLFLGRMTQQADGMSFILERQE